MGKSPIVGPLRGFEAQLPEPSIAPALSKSALKGSAKVRPATVLERDKLESILGPRLVRDGALSYFGKTPKLALMQSATPLDQQEFELLQETTQQIQSTSRNQLSDRDRVNAYAKVFLTYHRLRKQAILQQGLQLPNSIDPHQVSQAMEGVVERILEPLASHLDHLEIAEKFLKSLLDTSTRPPVGFEHFVSLSGLQVYTQQVINLQQNHQQALQLSEVSKAQVLWQVFEQAVVLRQSSLVEASLSELETTLNFETNAEQLQFYTQTMKILQGTGLVSEVRIRDRGLKLVEPMLQVEEGVPSSQGIKDLWAAHHFYHAIGEGGLETALALKRDSMILALQDTANSSPNRLLLASQLLQTDRLLWKYDLDESSNPYVVPADPTFAFKVIFSELRRHPEMPLLEQAQYLSQLSNAVDFYQDLARRGHGVMEQSQLSSLQSKVQRLAKSIQSRLDPFLEQAKQIPHPVERAEALLGFASIYQQAGLSQATNGILELITKISPVPLAAPAVLQALTKLQHRSQGMLFLNQGELEQARNVFEKIFDDPQAQFYLNQIQAFQAQAKQSPSERKLETRLGVVSSVLEQMVFQSFDQNNTTEVSDKLRASLEYLHALVLDEGMDLDQAIRRVPLLKQAYASTNTGALLREFIAQTQSASGSEISWEALNLVQTLRAAPHQDLGSAWAIASLLQWDPHHGEDFGKIVGYGIGQSMVNAQLGQGMEILAAMVPFTPKGSKAVTIVQKLLAARRARHAGYVTGGYLFRSLTAAGNAVELDQRLRVMPELMLPFMLARRLGVTAKSLMANEVGQGVGFFARPWAGRLGVWAAGSGAEAFGFTMGEASFSAAWHWDLAPLEPKHLAKKFGGMWVTFGLVHAVAKPFRALNQRAMANYQQVPSLWNRLGKYGSATMEWGARVHGFAGASLFNETVGLHEDQGSLGYAHRFASAALMDWQMIKAGKLVNGVYGGALERAELRTELKLRALELGWKSKQAERSQEGDLNLVPLLEGLKEFLGKGFKLEETLNPQEARQSVLLGAMALSKTPEFLKGLGERFPSIDVSSVETILTILLGGGLLLGAAVGSGKGKRKVVSIQFGREKKITNLVDTYLLMIACLPIDQAEKLVNVLVEKDPEKLRRDLEECLKIEPLLIEKDEFILLEELEELVVPAVLKQISTYREPKVRLLFLQAHRGRLSKEDYVEFLKRAWNHESQVLRDSNNLGSRLEKEVGYAERIIDLMVEHGVGNYRTLLEEVYGVASYDERWNKNWWSQVDEALQRQNAETLVALAKTAVAKDNPDLRESILESHPALRLAAYRVLAENMTREDFIDLLKSRWNRFEDAKTRDEFSSNSWGTLAESFKRESAQEIRELIRSYLPIEVRAQELARGRRKIEKAILDSYEEFRNLEEVKALSPEESDAIAIALLDGISGVPASEVAKWAQATFELAADALVHVESLNWTGQQKKQLLVKTFQDSGSSPLGKLVRRCEVIYLVSTYFRIYRNFKNGVALDQEINSLSDQYLAAAFDPKVYESAEFQRLKLIVEINNQFNKIKEELPFWPPASASKLENAVRDLTDLRDAISEINFHQTTWSNMELVWFLYNYQRLPPQDRSRALRLFIDILEPDKTAEETWIDLQTELYTRPFDFGNGFNARGLELGFEYSPKN